MSIHLGQQKPIVLSFHLARPPLSVTGFPMMGQFALSAGTTSIGGASFPVVADSDVQPAKSGRPTRTTSCAIVRRGNMDVSLKFVWKWFSHGRAPTIEIMR